MSVPAQTPISNRGLDGSFSTIAPYDRPLVLPDVTVSIDNFRLKFVYSQTAYDFDTKKRYDTLEYLMQRLTSESGIIGRRSLTRWIQKLPSPSW